MNDLYISVDIETDGPIPGENSMLSIGAAAYLHEGPRTFHRITTFSVNIEPMHGAHQDKDTMETFWSQNQAAWRVTTANPKPIGMAMNEFFNWVSVISDGKRPVMVAYPLNFDSAFIRYYLEVCGLRDPFVGMIDLKSYAAGKLGLPYQALKKFHLTRRWPLPTDTPEHTHIALDDAIEQGELFIRMVSQDPEVVP